MSYKTRADAVFLCNLMLLLLLHSIVVTVSTETDIYCLKSINDSLEDPYGYLNTSWNFNNNTDGFICRFNGVDCWRLDENKIINLKLCNMGLKGQFPLGIGNCTSLTGLNLSGNELHGSIPIDIPEKLRFVTVLDLSFNNMTGEIPSSIANFSYLNVLKLDNNRLTGQIPEQIAKLQRLREFSVANNMLTGKVPDFMNASYFTEETYANNTALCGGPLEKCESKESFASGFAVGYAVSSVIVIAGYASYFVPWLKVGNKNITAAAMILRMSTRRKNKKKAVHHLYNLSSTAEILDSQIVSLELMGLTAKRLPFSDMSKATDNFSESTAIGVGKTGTMYKATDPHGHLFAVKKLHNNGSLAERFISELRILGSLRHINLLQLQGFCTKSTEKLLVYKYMPNGNLYDWLHPNYMEGEVKVMEWQVKVKVAVGLARGLAWLHQGTKIRIIHLDFCSKCVLVDQDFEPKISNFGDAMLIGSDYINPVSRQLVLEMDFIKEDVLRFGIVLLELILKIDASKMNDSCDGVQDEWIKTLLSESSGYHGMIDTCLMGQGFDAEIYEVLKVALECVESIPEQRPTMVQVYQRIKRIAQNYGIVDDYELVMQPETSSAVKTGEIQLLEA